MANQYSTNVWLVGMVVNSHVTGNGLLSVTLKCKDHSTTPITITCLSSNTPERLLQCRVGNTIAAYGFITMARDRHSKKLVMTIFILKVEVILMTNKETDVIESIDNNNPDLVLGDTNKKGQLK